MTIQESSMAWRHGETWFKYFKNDEKSTNPPVIIIHGGPGAAHNYATPIALLLTNMGKNVLMYDQIGCGKSSHFPDAPSEFWNIDLFLEELDSLIKYLGFESGYFLLGHSWGGMLAMEHALQKPKGLRGLILSNTLSSMPLFREELLTLRKELPSDIQDTLSKHEELGTTSSNEYQEACKIFYNKHLIRIYRSHFSEESGVQRLKDPTVYHQMNGPSEFHVIGSLKDWDITDRLSEIENRTLIISGVHDECTPRLHALLNESIPNSKWELFDESSHSPYVEEAAKYARVLSEFIDGSK